MECLERVKERLREPMQMLKEIEGLPEIFSNCFLNTLETTVSLPETGGAFVITGDIPAMWLRDSTEQMLHYVRFAAQEKSVAQLIESLIARQVRCILTDPYANAFNQESNQNHIYNDLPVPGPEVWERKYEVDSLCHAVLLAERYYAVTGSDAIFTGDFWAAMNTIVKVFTVEQHHENQSSYSFTRTSCPPSDTLIRGGRGAQTSYTGMTWCGFRPSDDACTYGYLIPANLFAVKTLDDIESMASACCKPELAQRASRLCREIRKGIERFAMVEHPRFGTMYAYEVDGMGNHLLMDDANVPSLLSLPYLGVCANNEPLYVHTRAFVLSAENPYFFSGKAGKGIGSPHTPEGYIWPISLCVQAMTTEDVNEIATLVITLLQASVGTACMHEGFNKDDPTLFTRPWFAWANSMFGEMLYGLYERGMLAEVLTVVKTAGITKI